ncbi:MAG: Hpt domain-containing protein [Lachnospiraceae bacterium]|nr:Hpt domain-containing protein [Lachnospiraceae bacterium]
MLLEECYKRFGGNYEEVKSRLQNDDLISRFVIKFPADKSYEELSVAIREENYEEAFRAAHTLKGLSRNFSFDRLAESSSNLTELLRNREKEPVDKNLCEQLFLQVSTDYVAVTNAIKEFAQQVQV